MDQKKLEKKLGKKVTLEGRALSEVLSKGEQDLVAFWSFIENRATDRKLKHRKEQGKITAAEESRIDQDVEREGQQILDQFNGDARQALDSLI